MVYDLDIFSPCPICYGVERKLVLKIEFEFNHPFDVQSIPYNYQDIQ